jgi:hypothetical protein
MEGPLWLNMFAGWAWERQVKFPLILDMKEYCTEEYQAKISAWREKVRHICALVLVGVPGRDVVRAVPRDYGIRRAIERAKWEDLNCVTARLRRTGE